MKRRAYDHWTRLFTLVLALLMVFALSIVASAATDTDEEPECYDEGDVNTDGVVDSDDAIHTLYRFIFGDESYPVKQSWDFNQDGTLDNKDAIYLLYAAIWPEKYPLGGTVHGYFDPTWKWNDDLSAAEVTFKCSCGQEKVLSVADGVKITEKVTKEPTCTAPGEKTYTASVTFEGETFTHTKVTSVPARTTHQWKNGVEPGCETGGECELCGFKKEATRHKWELMGTIQAGCHEGENAVDHYACANCGAELDVPLEGTWGHQYELLDEPMYIEGTQCRYTGSRCVKCDAPNMDDAHTIHRYVAVITKEATCAEEGQKDYKCGDCTAPQLNEDGTEKVEVIEKNANHTWEEVTGEEYTHRCTVDGCGATKKVVVAEEGKVDMTNQNSSVEVNLGTVGDDEKQTTISLDDKVASGLTGEVQITVTQTHKAETGLSEEQQSQIPGETVYDFSMSAGDNQISDFEEAFAGSVTISLPYELEPGEDVDSITIWYIADDGTLTEITDAVYSNGYVTFTTTHFSYYTVTRLTAAQRCALYGHIEVECEKAPTCSEAGYHKVVCQRCGTTVSVEVQDATGHDYQEDKDACKEPSCTEDGRSEKECSKCHNIVKQDLPAKGHDLRLNSEKSSNANCQHAGKTVYSCAHGCGHGYEEKLPQQEHKYEVSETVDADCANKGHVKEACTGCGDERIKEEIAPKGHNYVVKEWIWAEDYYEATLVLVCEHDASHSKTLTAAVTHVEEEAVSCLGSGAVTHTAKVSYNGAAYADEKSQTTDAPGHKSDGILHATGGQHYYQCTVCEAKIDAETHKWGEGKVTTAPTCAEDGLQTVACTVCGYEKEETLPATGEHNYVYGVCKVCGFESEECNHELIHSTPLNMTGYAICKGLEVELRKCECGEHTSLSVVNMSCNLIITQEDRVSTDGMPYFKASGKCEDCGLLYEMGYYGELTEEGCSAVLVVESTLSLNGTVIAHSQEATEAYNHPPVVLEETVDLTKKGLCGEILELRSCPCGERKSWSTTQECNWEYDSESGQSYCVDCGAVYVMTYEEVEPTEPCQFVINMIKTYYLDGEEVFSCTNVHQEYMHQYELIDYKLMGTSCEDGLFITLKCAVCGDTIEDYVKDHMGIDLKKIDLSGYEICYDTLYQYSCPCEDAYRSYHMTGEQSCDFRWGYDHENDYEYQYCINCGVTYVETQQMVSKDEHCYGQILHTATYTDVNGKSFTAYQSGYTTQHEWEYSYKLLGDSCEQGVDIIHTCVDCGETDTYTDYYHIHQTLEYYDLSQYDLCVQGLELYSCPCGDATGIVWREGHCEREWVGEENNSVTFRCVNCGLVTVQSWSYRDGTEPCQQFVDQKFTLYLDEQELACISFTTEHINHDWAYELTLFEGATSCEDGYFVKGVCQKCGETAEHEEYGHGAYLVSKEVLGEGQMCGTIIVEEYRCACGYESWVNNHWEGDYCNFENGEYSEELGTWARTCTVCGISTWSTRTEEPIEGETCRVKVIWRSFYGKDGNVLFSYDETGTDSNHDYTYSYILLGDSCEDGYNVQRDCTKCGVSYIDEAEIYYDHNRYVVDSEIVHDGTGICGQMVKEYMSCPCGESTSEGLSHSCNFEYIGWEEDMETFQCVNCGLKERWEETRVRREGSCMVDATRTSIFVLNDTVIHTHEYSWSYESHEYVCTFDGTCEEGYYITRSCVYCDESYREEELYTGHDRRRVAYIDLSEYGLCGGYLEHYSCACGLEGHVQISNSMCNWECTDEYNEYFNTEEQYCSGCNTYKYEQWNGQEDPENCHYSYTKTYFFVRNDEILLQESFVCGYAQHTTEVIGATLHNEGGSCVDGVTVTRQCKYCDEIFTEEYWHHMRTYEKRTKLSETCGTEIVEYHCACGKESGTYYNMFCNMSGSYREETGADGYVHFYHDSACNDCGLKRSESGYFVETDVACLYDYNNHVVFTMGDTVVGTVDLSGHEERHDYHCSNVALDEGSQTCDDGIVVTETCADCGYSYNYETNWHRTIVVESYDLTQYGSVCGGSLEHHVCACGENDYYEFSNDTKCDLDTMGIEVWIDGALDEISQYTSEGYQWYDSHAYVYTCSVTDPTACGLKIRMSEYWLPEGCTATRYQVWQLGYDEATGTCQQEITLALETRAYHNYTEEYVSETQEDGLYVNGTVYTCPDCGSTFEDLYYYENDQLVKSTYVGINTLDNGENQKLTYIHEYGFHFTKGNDTFNLCTRYYDEYVQADGTIIWYQEVREYDEATFGVDGRCVCISTYTRYDEEGSRTQENECHNLYYDEEYFYGSCTQDGYCQWKDTCSYCDTVVNSDTYPVDPIAHSWSWNDEKQTYVCELCALENINGASGSIVLEDMTGKYDGTNYVVGYWNRGNINYEIRVSVMLYDLDDQRILNVAVSEMEDVRAVSFSQSEAQAAAAEIVAELGYTGSYAIRISFVPTDGAHELDYAITFDAQ